MSCTAISILSGMRAGSLCHNYVSVLLAQTLLADDLSNLPLLFNPSQHCCYADLYIDHRAAFLADMSLERQKPVFNFYLILLMKPPSCVLTYTGHGMYWRKNIYPWCRENVQNWPTRSTGHFLAFRKLSLRDCYLKEYKYSYHIGTQKAQFNYASFNLSERKQSSVWSWE